jgi:hypothetical protein
MAIVHEVGLSDVVCHPPEHLSRRFHHPALLVLFQVPPLKHGQGIGGKMYFGIFDCHLFFPF